MSTIPPWFPVNGPEKYIMASVANAIHSQTGAHVNCELVHDYESMIAHVMVIWDKQWFKIRYDVPNQSLHLEDLRDLIVQIKLMQ